MIGEHFQRLTENYGLSELVSRALTFASSELAADTTGHDPSHLSRVVTVALQIASGEHADLEHTALVAALHDVQDFKFTGDEMSGAVAASDWLRAQGAGAELAAAVADDVSGISFKGASTQARLLSHAGRCVQDADRMDALGAIGIARCFAYGGAVGRPIHDPDVPIVMAQSTAQYLDNKGTSINHFYEKLLLLSDRMNTQSGKAIAQERTQFMRQFLDQFYAEWECRTTERLASEDVR